MKMNGYHLLGNFRGVVVDNVDPLKLNRVRVRVHGLFDGVEDAHLPWAVAAFPLMTGAGIGYGWFGVPKTGTEVWCFFEAGDYNQPVYFAEAPDGVRGHPTVADTNYPDRRGFCTAAGHYIYVDDVAGEIHVHHSGGSYFSITSTLMKLFAGGATIEIDSGGNITISGTRVNINP